MSLLHRARNREVVQKRVPKIMQRSEWIIKNMMMQNAQREPLNEILCDDLPLLPSAASVIKMEKKKKKPVMCYTAKDKKMISSRGRIVKAVELLCGPCKWC